MALPSYNDEVLRTCCATLTGQPWRINVDTSIKEEKGLSEKDFWEAVRKRAWFNSG